MENHDLTDEDSADSEDETKNLPSVLSGNQLCAPAEKRHLVNDSDDENVPLSYFSNVSHCFDWYLLTKNMYCSAFPESNYTKYRGYSPTKFFELCFDDETTNIITEILFMKLFVMSQNISHDKSMVEYFGRHGCTHTILNKSIRFGYKIWCQNLTAGYLVNFEPYQGSCNVDETNNYFTTLPLMIEMKSRGYNSTGTIRANRIPFLSKLTNKK
ncbi:hypothetical protein A3Q56_02224 [Intoshia linei]|uniref:PiggyBac transposable element-derived protein domain-containing protein n=1 Tax=Intoshia linei TaxID=1819745 RepID=A0A177B9A2_9BILA|nr:hypothetical protein A3Q56_02224 [Intoshia linei]